MPKKSNKPQVISVAKKRWSQKTKSDVEGLLTTTSRLGSLVEEIDRDITATFRRLVPDYDGSPRSTCKVIGILAKHFPKEPIDDWHQLPVQELLGYVDAVTCESDATLATPKATPGKKSEKYRRPPNAHAAAVAKLIKQDRKQGLKTPKNHIIRDYVEANEDKGARFSSIKKTLEENPHMLENPRQRAT
jgi:hypothetical protein